MKSYNTYLKILLLAGGCLFTAGLYAAEEGMEEDVMADEGMAADEGMEEEGMLEEEGEELPPLYTSEFEAGIGYSTTTTFSAGAFKFGEYNGLEDDGAFAIGNLKFRKYSVIGDDDNDYWELQGTNLGLDPRNVYGEYSHDGTYGDYGNNSGYRLFFEYDQIPHNQFEDGQTPFLGAGTTNQTLPVGWVPSDSTAGMTELLSSLNNVELETERQRMGGGFRWDFTDHWAASASYRHENKEGTDPIGAIFGTSGGNPRGSVIAVPIDYEFDEFNANLAYTGKKGQASLNYHLSLFENNDNSVLFTNPFENPPRGWDVGAGYSEAPVAGQGQLSLFPDNQAHQVQFAGGYNFTPMTRATTTISYSRWLQDQNFLPYSHLFPGGIATPLPRSSLDGDIATLFANVNLYSRLTNKLDAKARYTYEDRDNKTPRDVYLRMPNDSAATQPALADANARINWPYEMTRHLVELDGGYRITPMTKLQLGYVYERKERDDFSEVSDTDEHTGKVRLSATPFNTASGWIKYSHSWLDGSDYVANQPLLTGHTQDFIDDELTGCATPPNECAGLFENNPFIRKYHFANRDRDRVQAAINFYPTEKVDFTVNGEYRDDDYDDTPFGLQKSRRYIATLDAGWRPTDRFNAYAFGTYEVYQYDQRGYEHSSEFAPVDPLDPDAIWTTDTEDETFMAGTGFEWFVVEDKFKLNLDFIWSQTTTSFDQTLGGVAIAQVGGTHAVLPDVTTDLYNISVKGEYTIKDNVKARLGYMYERYITHDFGLDMVDPDTLTNVILLGQQSPNYSAHVFGLSFVYEFQ